MENSEISNKNRFIVIMAGGRGERFWPVSRQATPKQLITLIGERSFLQQTVDRLGTVVPKENIFIITNKVQAKAVQKQLPELPLENVIAEPCGRDTCAAVTLGAAIVGHRDPNGVLAILAADHVIPNPGQFQQVLADAFSVAEKNKVIVTIGIKPTEPATGYGYIKTGATFTSSEGDLNTAFFIGEKFVEKPVYEKAVEYLNSGNYRWNAGMFIFSVSTISEALHAFEPELAQALDRWRTIGATPRLSKWLNREYPEIKKISVDYAIMEKATNVVVADGSFEWDDLGAWPAMSRHLPKDEQGNCAVGTLITIDSENNVVFDARTKNRTPIGLVGIKDSIVVQTNDALLVASKAQSQKIKELVAKLSQNPEFKKLV
jgi:mannose-1-phosphate guanylyltransferase